MELYFVEWMNDTMLTSSVEAQQGEIGGVHMNLDHESNEENSHKGHRI